MSKTQVEKLASILHDTFAEKLVSLSEQLGELTIAVRAEDMQSLTKTLRDDPALDFDTLMDLCGVDYLFYGGTTASDARWNGRRFAVVYHLLSIKHNRRLRVKAFAENDEFPIVDSVIETWPSANWFEREAFDLYGIVFNGHPDLRRILTDYGFIGNPFRKDFPLSGNVEMRYDADQKRVIYQPVSIEPREITPRVIREERYGDKEHFGEN